MILGFDPGKDKCGIAVVSEWRDEDNAQRSTLSLNLVWSAVVASAGAIATVRQLSSRYPISIIVMGDQTTSTVWKENLEQTLETTVVLVDERYSTLEARTRYWQLYPPKGLTRLVPQALRSISRPIDDVVALILVERYIQNLRPSLTTVSVSSVP